jgi:membrane protein insertase Oxa1/YidC/SpoIIIJ
MLAEARRIKVRTDHWTATISNRGAVITEWMMTSLPNGKSIDPPNGVIWFMTSAPAGLVLYWMVGNLTGIVQQFVINRLNPSGGLLQGSIER